LLVRWVFAFGAAVIGDDGGLVFVVESLMGVHGSGHGGGLTRSDIRE